MLYIPSQNIYLDKFGTYTDEELDYYAELEHRHKKLQRPITFYQALEIFPTAKPAIKRNLKKRIEENKADIKKAKRLEKEVDEIIRRLVPDLNNRWFWNILKEELIIKPLKIQQIKQNKKYSFYLQHIKRKEAEDKLKTETDPKRVKKWKEVLAPHDRITDQDIQQAKEVLITNFVEETPRNGFIKCLFHSENTASLKIYYKTNTFYCYGCSASGDAINFVMYLYGYGFLEAVNFLLNK